jgi:hypothetical protein
MVGGDFVDAGAVDSKEMACASRVDNGRVVFGVFGVLLGRVMVDSFG